MPIERWPALKKQACCIGVQLVCRYGECEIRRAEAHADEVQDLIVAKGLSAMGVGASRHRYILVGQIVKKGRNLVSVYFMCVAVVRSERTIDR